MGALQTSPIKPIIIVVTSVQCFIIAILIAVIIRRFYRIRLVIMEQMVLMKRRKLKKNTWPFYKTSEDHRFSPED